MNYYEKISKYYDDDYVRRKSSDPMLDFKVTRRLKARGESYAQYLRRYWQTDWRVGVL